jgi:hypothetical protein
VSTWPIVPFHPSDKARSVAHVVKITKQRRTHKQALALSNYATHLFDGSPSRFMSIFDETHYTLIKIVKNCQK